MDTTEINGEVTHGLSVRQMNKVVRRLRLKDNDVILVKEETEMAKKPNMDSLATAVGNTGVRGIIVIVVQSLNDISSLSTEQMQQHGWYKFEDAAALIMDRYYKDEERTTTEETKEQ